MLSFVIKRRTAQKSKHSDDGLEEEQRFLKTKPKAQQGC